MSLLSGDANSVLSDVAAQLSAQISFSNELMAQVAAYETQQEETQRQASAQSAALRTCASALEASRTEAADLRARLLQSQVRAPSLLL
jgi:hypothetical protein